MKELTVSFSKICYTKILAFGVIFDPRYKFEFVEYALKKLHGEFEGLRKVGDVRLHFDELYNAYEYNGGVLRSSYTTHEPSLSMNPIDDFAEFAAYDRISAATSEIDMYLSEKQIALETQLDVLDYWKENSNRFPILSSMARDILVIPITAVAS